MSCHRVWSCLWKLFVLMVGMLSGRLAVAGGVGVHRLRLPDVPRVNDRRKVPSAGGARTPPNSRPFQRQVAR